MAGIAKDARGFAELVFIHQDFLARDDKLTVANFYAPGRR
ncbi:hypothetical protein BN136_534 [Cronobacter universalis NCTC 9529]|nr:hypothetical protein BN136_534 [Cronobacter universalis NCTC 9529]